MKTSKYNKNARKKGIFFALGELKFLPPKFCILGLKVATFPRKIWSKNSSIEVSFKTKKENWWDCLEMRMDFYKKVKTKTDSCVKCVLEVI